MLTIDKYPREVQGIHLKGEHLEVGDTILYDFKYMSENDYTSFMDMLNERYQLHNVFGDEYGNNVIVYKVLALR